MNQYAFLAVREIDQSLSPDTDRFKFLFALIPLLTLVLSPLWHSYDGVFVLPAVLLIVHWWDQFQRLKPLGGAVVVITAAVLAWQWLAALGLASLALVQPSLAQSWQILPWLPILFAPTLMLISLLLIARRELA